MLTTGVWAQHKKGASQNLVVNGDFSKGNSQFTSQYDYTIFNYGEGEYTVTGQPLTWNKLLADCRDRTSGNGNMLLVNGATAANRVIWQQTIDIQPNTAYDLAAWLQNANVHKKGSNPPKLQFVINGIKMGNGVQVGYNSFEWAQMESVWNSGKANKATIGIINLNTIAPGNDFAIDDISFTPLKAYNDLIVKRKVKKQVQQATIETKTNIETVKPETAKAEQVTWPQQAVIAAPFVLANRVNELASTIATSENEIEINIYDNGTIDNDTISVYLDKMLVLSKQRLTAKALTLKINLNETANYHELVMVAENLGEIPPNTSLMVVKAGKKQYEVRITSTEQKNAVVVFTYAK
ncbi:hypothetical protein [Niastella sp. OAS944]|uniref:hypothetical protein n=1 Tax=Niastella sp. OAS944 TaxID=2664089 RepID=UPI0034975C22|nr:hypothetical protein [Chitinophagaceae bacterium OAS944]